MWADEDIESNMLRPPGVTVEQVDMGVRVYRGEDIPKMDLSFKTGQADNPKLATHFNR